MTKKQFVLVFSILRLQADRLTRDASPELRKEYMGSIDSKYQEIMNEYE